FEFTVTHIGPCSGTVEVNESITYDDAEDNTVVFPSPTIDVDCGIVICPEGCSEKSDITINGCKDTLEFDAGEIGMDSLGRILQLDVTLKNVCPHKRVALAVILNELDKYGAEHKRGLKTITIPAHTKDTCRDISVRCIKFILPENLDEAGSFDSICNERKFRARFFANYIDHDFECCCDKNT
ncbi:MAG: VWA domain-containing protein, partial [Eubacteriales bacterium]